MCAHQGGRSCKWWRYGGKAEVNNRGEWGYTLGPQPTAEGGGGQCVFKYLLPTAHLAPCPHPPGCLSGLEVSHTLHLLLSSPLSLCFFSCLFLFLNKQDAKYLFSMHFFFHIFLHRGVILTSSFHNTSVRVGKKAFATLLMQNCWLTAGLFRFYTNAALTHHPAAHSVLWDSKVTSRWLCIWVHVPICLPVYR